MSEANGHPPHRQGRTAAELNRERAALREDPDRMRERLDKALVVIGATEYRKPPRDLAAAYRLAVGDPSVPADEARRLGRDLKTWAKRTVGTSLTVHLLAAGLGVDALVEGIAEQLQAVKTAADGTVRLDPAGEPIPDLVTRRRALPILSDALVVAGLVGPHKAPDVAQLEAEAARRLAELETANGHATNGAAAAVGG